MNKQQLQQALEIVRPGLANKEIIEQTTSFAFTQGCVVTYNDEVSIRHPIDGLTIEGAVHADELYKLLSKITGDDFELSIVENEIQMKAGRLRAGLTLQHEMKLPLEEIGEVKGWKPLPEHFIDAMRFVVSCCSRDMSRPVLTCVHVNVDGFVEGSDAYRIARYNVDAIPFTFLIPATSVVELIKLKPTKITSTSGWVHFQTDEGTVISCRVFEEAFPDTTPFLDVEGIQIHLPRDITDILDRASVFAKRDFALEEEVTVNLEKNNLKIRSESDVGWFEEDVRVRYTDSPLVFSIQPYMLKDILKETLTCTLGEDRLKFTGDAGWTYITTLKSKAE